ncbi:hypothetical protein ACFSTD_11980 [Novosphingobium colocasiae]
MIWGGRLISPTGLFAAENADLNGNPTSRNLIFPHRWRDRAAGRVLFVLWGRGDRSAPVVAQLAVHADPDGGEPLHLCLQRSEKKRNVTVWVIGFGTQMTDMLKNCAGDGRWFQANNAAQLSDAFSSIAKSMGDLRISK